MTHDVPARVTWYENTDGEGTFATGIDISTTADAPNFVVAADLDSDGDLDVVATSFDGDLVTWFENTDGEGDFSQGINLSNFFVVPRQDLASSDDPRPQPQPPHPPALVVQVLLEPSAKAGDAGVGWKELGRIRFRPFGSVPLAFPSRWRRCPSKMLSCAALVWVAASLGMDLPPPTWWRVGDASIQREFIVRSRRFS